MKVFQAIARKLDARDNCLRSPGTTGDWAQKHEEDALALAVRYLPSGSGFDAGTKLYLVKSTPQKLVFLVSFYHMDDHGGYIGWSEHEVIVKASLTWGFDLRVTGRDRRKIKEYIGERFDFDLRQEVKK